MAEVLELYAQAAAELGPRFEALDAAAVLAPVRRYLPEAPADIVDIGAGSGRDAAWLAELGHRVTAVEPVAALADYGRARHGGAFGRVADSLPELAVLRAEGRRFDCALLVAVWHHLSAGKSARALLALFDVMRPGGQVILSLKRFGDGRASLRRDDVLAHAEAVGFSLVAVERAASQQDFNREAGIMWDWLVLKRDAREGKT